MSEIQPTKLSDNFYLYEFVASPTAERNNIDNTPEPEHITNMRALCVNVLEPARSILNFPINITSGFRSPSLNNFINASLDSQHSRGQAVDCTSKDNSELFFAIVNNVEIWDQLIWEFGDDYAPSWVHVSYKRVGRNRKQTLKAVKSKGKTIYLPFFDDEVENV